MTTGLGEAAYRSTPLPRGDLQGRYLVTQEVIDLSRKVFRRTALAGIRAGGHEGLVFWAGVQLGSWTCFTTVVIPQAKTSPHRVDVDEAAYGSAAQEAGNAGVGLLAQVHTHPGSDARHSEGDDHMIILPFEGMLSIVVPHYGVNWNRIADACVHQFQVGRWILCEPDSVRNGLRVAPAKIDLTGSSA